MERRTIDYLSFQIYVYSYDIYLIPWPTWYLPIARVIINKKFGHAQCHSFVQPCARTGAKCILLMTCIFRGYKRNCEIINNVNLFLRRIWRNHDQLIS